MKTSLSSLLTLLALACLLPVRAQVVPPKDPKGLDRQVQFSATPLDQILDEYAQIVGRTLIKAPSITPITITLNSPKGQVLTPKEYLLAIESVLALNNITFVPQGEKFLKVVMADAAQKENLPIRIKAPGEVYPATDDLVSQVVEIKHLEPAEVQPLLQELIHPYAKIQLLERNNAVLITDTSANVQRILEILKYIDVSIESKEEPRIYQLKHAKAADVSSRLTDLIAESQQELQKRGARAPISSSGSPVRSATPTNPATPPSPVNVIRAVPPATGASAGASGTTSESAGGQGGLVQGKVKIVSDERTNILIIISKPDNFAFFDDMIEVLDRQVEPEMSVEVIRLEFSEADEMSGILSDLIGGSSGSARRSSSSSSRASFRGDSNSGGSNNRNSNNNNSNDSRNSSVRDFINRNATDTSAANRSPATPGAPGDLTGVANISENTRIISDPRTNAILILGRKEDIFILRQVVTQLDVMLAQVLLEALILEVNLNDNLSMGVDWLQRSLLGVRQNTQGPRGGLTVAEPVFAFGGGQNLGTGAIQDGANVTRATALNPGALTYFGTFTDLNLDAVISLAAGDSDARVLSAPVIITTDNTEASIQVGERRPIPTTTSASGVNGSDRTTVEYEDIGIELQVKPRISPNRVVSMEVQQKVDNVGGTVTIDGNDVPIITTRQLEASITMTNKTTLVLGGLVSEDKRDSQTKVPILGDIPLIGALFRRTTKVNNRTELLVLITPHVIMSVEDAIAETERLHKSTKLDSSKASLNQWSGNSLVDENDGMEGRTVPLRRYRNQVEDLRHAREQQAAVEARNKTIPVSTKANTTIRIPPGEMPHPVEPLKNTRLTPVVASEAKAAARAQAATANTVPTTPVAPEPAPEPTPIPAAPAPAPAPIPTPAPATPPAVPVDPAPRVPAPADPAPAATPAGNASLLKLPSAGRDGFRAQPVINVRALAVDPIEEAAAPPLR